MNPLPSPMDMVVRTKPFKPSSMAVADQCLLAAILPSCEHGLERLKPSPFMLFGSAYHRLFEMIAKGQLPGEDRDAVSSAFDGLIEQFESMGKGAIKEPLGETRFERMRLAALRKAETISSPDAFRGAGKASRLAEESPIRPGSEKQIKSNGLELEGKCDRIIFGPRNEITVVDYKWSTPGGATGSHSVDDFIQLELYGLVIQSQVPNAKIRLRIEGVDGEEERKFSKAQALARQEWLQSIQARAPKGVPNQAEQLANAGAHCARCNHRHICRRYLRDAPTAWSKKALPAPWPFDAWGRLDSVALVNGQYELQIQGMGDTYFRITGLSPSHFGSGAPLKDSLFYLFGLQPYPLGRGASHHPDNFYESPPYRGYPKAWATEVFVEK